MTVTQLLIMIGVRDFMQQQHRHPLDLLLKAFDVRELDTAMKPGGAPVLAQPSSAWVVLAGRTKARIDRREPDLHVSHFFKGGLWKYFADPLDLCFEKFQRFLGFLRRLSQQTLAHPYRPSADQSDRGSHPRHRVASRRRGRYRREGMETQTCRSSTRAAFALFSMWKHPSANPRSNPKLFDR